MDLETWLEEKFEQAVHDWHSRGEILSIKVMQKRFKKTHGRRAPSEEKCREIRNRVGMRPACRNPLPPPQPKPETMPVMPAYPDDENFRQQVIGLLDLFAERLARLEKDIGYLRGEWEGTRR